MDGSEREVFDDSEEVIIIKLIKIQLYVLCTD